jgi:hypothetical protein
MGRTLHFALAPLGAGAPGQDGLRKDARVQPNGWTLRQTVKAVSVLPVPVNRHSDERTLVTA